MACYRSNNEDLGACKAAASGYTAHLEEILFPSIEGNVWNF